MRAGIGGYSLMNVPISRSIFFFKKKLIRDLGHFFSRSAKGSALLNSIAGKDLLLEQDEVYDSGRINS